MRKLLAVAAAAGLMTISGAAFSGGSWTADVQVLNFDTATGTMLAFWSAGNQGVFLVDTDTTVHLPAAFTHSHPVIPADPCHGYLHEYNAAVAQFDRSGTARASLYISILHLANANCSADVAADTSNGNLVTFQPHD
jgi:hypothetical protein